MRRCEKRQGAKHNAQPHCTWSSGFHFIHRSNTARALLMLPKSSSMNVYLYLRPNKGSTQGTSHTERTSAGQTQSARAQRNSSSTSQQSTASTGLKNTRAQPRPRQSTATPQTQPRHNYNRPQIRTEQSRAEQSRAEQSRAQPQQSTTTPEYAPELVHTGKQRHSPVPNVARVVHELILHLHLRCRE